MTAREPHTPYGRVEALSVFSLFPDLLFHCSRVLEYAKIRTVLQSRSGPPPPSFPSRARLIFACLLYFRDLPRSLAQTISYQSLTKAFRGCHIFSLVTCGEERNTSLPRMPACGTHVMHSCACSLSEKMRIQLIFVANYWPKMAFIFLFCLTFVGCLPEFGPSV